MLKTTSQQLIDSLGYEGGRVGQPQIAGITIDQANQSVTATAGKLLDVPIGQVFLATHIVMQIDQSSHLGTRVASPSAAESVNTININDPDGALRDAVSFRGFSRYRSIFTDGGGTPDFRASQPGEIVSWRPKYAIAIPSGWEVDMPQSVIAWGHQASIYGTMVSESAARQLGYEVSASGTPDTARRQGVSASSGSIAGATMVTGRTGQCIRVLDVHIRSQPEVAAANTLTLSQGDGQAIFKFVNDNPAELINQSFSPDWYLKSGEDLDVQSDNEGTCSVNISYEFVDEDEVPSDSWFAIVTPDLATPGTGTYGLTSLLTEASTEVTLYYAKPDASGSHTRTSPTKGFQHMLRGYSVFCQKSPTTQNATDDTEQVRFAISTGAAGSRIGFSLGLSTQANYQMSPVFSGSGHDQCTWGVVEGINIPGKKDDGSLWVDTMGFDTIAATPSSTNLNIRDWAVNLWGRTASTTFSPRTNRGT